MTARQPWLGIKTRDWFINSDTPQTHLRTVSADAPILPATDWIAAHSDPCCCVTSATSRTARARCSAENLTPGMTPSPHRSESLRKPGRFNEDVGCRATWLDGRRPSVALAAGQRRWVAVLEGPSVQSSGRGLAVRSP